MTQPASPAVEENRFFDRCIHSIERPVWMDDLIAALPLLQKTSESGEVVIVAVDPDGDLKLCGYLLCSGCQIVYAFQSDVVIDEEKPFWSFASDNYKWVTPSIKLRKEVAARMGGKADGVSFKNKEGDALSAEAFIESITGKPIARAAPQQVGDVEVGANLSLF